MGRKSQSYGVATATHAPTAPAATVLKDRSNKRTNNATHPKQKQQRQKQQQQQQQQQQVEKDGKKPKAKKMSLFKRIKSIRKRSKDGKAVTRPTISSPQQPRPLDGLRTTPRTKGKFGFGNNNFSTSPRRQVTRQHGGRSPHKKQQASSRLGSGLYTALKTMVSPRVERQHRQHRQQQRAEGRVRMHTAPTSADQQTYEAMYLNRIPPADAVRQFARSNMRQNRKTALKELRRNTLPAPADGSGSPFVSASGRPRGVGHGSSSSSSSKRAGEDATVIGDVVAAVGARRLGSRRLKVSKQSMRRAEAPKIALASTALPTPPATPEPTTAAARGFPGFEMQEGTEWPATPTAAEQQYAHSNNSTATEEGDEEEPTMTLSFALNSLQPGIEMDEGANDEEDDEDVDDDDEAEDSEDDGEDEDDSDFDDSEDEDDDYDELNDSEIEV